MIWMSFIKRCARTYFDQEKVKCATRKGFTESEMLDHLHKLANKTK